MNRTENTSGKSRIKRLTRIFFSRRRLSAALLGLLLTGVVLRWEQLSPWLRQGAAQTAALSAALAMPEVTIDYLKSRYSTELVPPSQTEQPSIPVLPQDETASQSSSASRPLPPDTLVPEQEITSSSAPQEPPEQSSSSSQSQQTENGPSITDIPAAQRGRLVEKQYTATAGGRYISYGDGLIQNTTTLSNEEVLEILETPARLNPTEEGEPQVLIYHTHATEAFEPYDRTFYDKRYNWRSRDNTNNMVAVGTVLAETLEENGISVVHIETQHDYPSYNGAYEKSAQTIQEVLEQYPSIQVILDVHRDAIQEDSSTIVKAVAEIEGEKTAQLMIIAGCDDDGSLGMPRWRENLRFAAALQSRLEGAYPGLTRPVLFSYRKYNMDLCPNGALIEFGSHGNTLEEAKRAARMVGEQLAALLKGEDKADQKEEESEGAALPQNQEDLDRTGAEAGAGL